MQTACTNKENLFQFPLLQKAIDIAAKGYRRAGTATGSSMRVLILAINQAATIFINLTRYPTLFLLVIR